MSDYTLVQRGTILATSADAAGPKDFNLPNAVKLGSSFISSTIRSKRCRKRIQRFTVNLTNASVSPVNTVIPTAVDENCSHIEYSIKENRADPHSGVNLRILAGGASFDITFGTIGAGETVDLEVEIVEEKEPLGALIRLFDTTTVRMEWDGTLAAGETIDGHFEVHDLEDLGDDIKELLFRGERILAMLGENQLQDNVVIDEAGNMTTYRIRTFDSKASADAATINTTGGLEAGETARITMTQTIRKDKNDRTDMKRVQTDVAPTPGVN